MRKSLRTVEGLFEFVRKIQNQAKYMVDQYGSVSPVAFLVPTVNPFGQVYIEPEPFMAPLPSVDRKSLDKLREMADQLNIVGIIVIIPTKGSEVMCFVEHTTGCWTYAAKIKQGQLGDFEAVETIQMEFIARGLQHAEKLATRSYDA